MDRREERRHNTKQFDNNQKEIRNLVKKYNKYYKYLKFKMKCGEIEIEHKYEDVIETVSDINENTKIDLYNIVNGIIERDYKKIVLWKILTKK